MGRPVNTFHGFCGQKGIVDSLRQHCRGALAQKVPLPHTLLAGPSGIGKTALAAAVAKEMGSVCHSVFCSGDTKKTQLVEKLAALSKADILFLDEVHALDPDCQELLYPAIDSLTVPKVEPGTNRLSAEETVTIQPFTLIAASNQCGRLRDALKGRITLTCTLDSYTLPELRLIVCKCAADLGILLKPQAATRIAEAARGLPRKARHLLESIKLTRASGAAVSKADAVRCLKLLGIDDDNLDDKDRRYIAFIAQRGGHVSMQNIATALGLDRQMVATDIEGYLVKRGLVGIEARGRFLTSAGSDLALKRGLGAVPE